jgi:hypothetical protein
MAIHRMVHAIGRIHAVEILGHLRTQEPARHVMRGITLNFRRPPIFHSDQNAEGIRAIVRTSGMNNLPHRGMIIKLRRRPHAAEDETRDEQRTSAVEAAPICGDYGTTRSRALPKPILIGVFSAAFRSRALPKALPTRRFPQPESNKATISKSAEK